MESLRLPQSGDGLSVQCSGHQIDERVQHPGDRQPRRQVLLVGRERRPGLLDTFRWPHSVILAKEGPNDGLVSVHSARWGEYRGTLVGVKPPRTSVGWVNTFRYNDRRLDGRADPVQAGDILHGGGELMWRNPQITRLIPSGRLPRRTGVLTSTDTHYMHAQTWRS